MPSPPARPFEEKTAFNLLDALDLFTRHKKEKRHGIHQ